MSARLSNLSAVLYKANDIRLEDRPVQEPGDYDVLLEMNCVGICGSDVHYWKRGGIGRFVLKKPMVLGHESSGTVYKVGSKVTSLKIGDRVAVEPGVPCRICEFCKSGRYNLCPDVKFCATPPDDGSLCKYFTHPADFCYKLPDHVRLEEGALLEPLSVAVHACKRGNIFAGSHVLILGSGPIGLMTLLTAKAMGASKIVVTDLLESRLALAEKLGADRVVLVNKELTEVEIASKIEGLFGGLPDRTFDCSGFETTVKLGILVTKPGGVLVVVGMGADEVKIPLVECLFKEVDIRGVFRYANAYGAALELVSSGRVDVKPLITHNYGIENTVRAFETAHADPRAVKVMIHVNNSTCK